MDIKGLMKEFNEEGIRNNYNKWINIAYDIMIKNKKVDIDLDGSKLDYLVNELIAVINEKIHNNIKLNDMETDVFLHSFICYVLERLNIKSLTGYTYIEPDGKRLMDNWSGVCQHADEGSFIYYNKSILNDFANTDIDLTERLLSLITLAHELVHVKQNEDMKSGVIGLDNYVMTLERILRLGKFYFENYSYVRAEVDADSRAIDLLCDFYEKHHVYSQDVMIEFKQCMKIYTEYNINRSENHNVTVDNIEQDISIYYSLYKSSEYIKENPQLINKYPILSLVYNENGNLYSVKELFEKRKNMLSSVSNIPELNRVYEHILISYQSFMDLDEILNEIKIYLNSVSQNDIFATWMLEKLVMPRKIITENDLDNKIQQRILNL